MGFTRHPDHHWAICPVIIPWIKAGRANPLRRQGEAVDRFWSGTCFLRGWDRGHNLDFYTGIRGIAPGFSPGWGGSVFLPIRDRQFGFLPNRNGQSEQSAIGQRRTSALLSPEHSRHFFRIACTGVILHSPRGFVICPRQNPQ